MSRYNVLRLGKLATFLVLMLLWASAAPIDARIEHDNGIVRVKSTVPMSEAITRIKADIATKGIKFFDEIDQSKLAADAGIKLRPSPPCSSLVIRRSARNLSRPTPMRGWTGRFACC